MLYIVWYAQMYDSYVYIYILQETTLQCDWSGEVTEPEADPIFVYVGVAGGEWGNADYYHSNIVS